jgi:predicted nucleic acid-binding protein
MLSTRTLSNYILFDAGMFIGALLHRDTRHPEARPLVEAARMGTFKVCTTNGILSEVYAALTWVGAQPQHTPEKAAHAVRLLIEPPSAIYLLPDNREISLKMLELAEKYHLTARRVHDARHAAMAIVSGVRYVYTSDVDDWNVFSPEGLTITGPNSILQEISSDPGEEKI